MDNYEQIVAGNKVEFYLKNISKFEDKRHLVSSVVSRQNDQRIITILNVGVEDRCDIIKGSVYQFIFYTPIANLMCNGVIQRHRLVDGESQLDVRITSRVEKSSLRSSERYECTMPVKYSLIHKHERYTDDPVVLYEGVALDISGGGIKFRCNQNLAEKSRLRLILEKAQGSIWIEGVIVSRKYRKSETSEYDFEYGVRFITKKQSKRKDIRFRCCLPMRYAIYDMNEKFLTEFIPLEFMRYARVENISRGGAMIRGDCGLFKDTILNMVIERPEGQMVIQGSVVNNSCIDINNLFVTSIRFINLPNGHNDISTFT